MREPKELPEATEQVRLLELFDEDYSEFVALGKRIGLPALNALLETLGGQKAHIPMPTSFWSGLVREERDTKIRSRFHGDNYDELAAEFEMTERQIRNIVNGPSERRSAERSESTRPVQLSKSHYDALTSLAAVRGVSIRVMVDALLTVALEHPELEQRLNAVFPQMQLLPAA